MTWRGWLTVILFLGAVVFGAVTLLGDTPKNTFSAGSFMFLTLLVIAIILAVIVSSMKGPKPKWRWGSNPTDNPDEDM